MADWGIESSIRVALDKSKIQDFLRRKEAEVLVGFPSGRPHIDARHDQDTDTGDFHGGTDASKDTSELAAELYYGTAVTPSRPFLTDGLEGKKKELREMIEAEARKESPNWNRIGTAAVGFIQEFVRGDHYRKTIPNSEQTIQEKGSDTPLIDSADLINSLTYILEDK